MRKCHVLTLGLLVAGGLLLIFAARGEGAGTAKPGGEVRKLSDGELARAVGGTKTPCCSRMDDSAGMCTQAIPITPPLVPGGAFGCTPKDGTTCVDSVFGEPCSWALTGLNGPNYNDKCANKSNTVGAICNPPIAGWCAEYTSNVCVPTFSLPCKCDVGGGNAYGGTRMYCDYPNAGGVWSTNCP